MMIGGFTLVVMVILGAISRRLRRGRWLRAAGP